MYELKKIGGLWCAVCGNVTQFKSASKKTAKDWITTNNLNFLR